MGTMPTEALGSTTKVNEAILIKEDDDVTLAFVALGSFDALAVTDPAESVFTIELPYKVVFA